MAKTGTSKKKPQVIQPQVKRLTTEIVKEQSELLNEQIDITVYSKVNGESYELTIDKNIRHSKTLKYISEFMVQAQYARDKKIDLQDIMVEYCIFLLIKHFTSLGIDIPSDLESQIIMMNNLIDLHLLGVIVDSFNEDEVVNIFEEIKRNMTKAQDTIKSIDDKIAKIQLGFEDKDDVTFVTEESTELISNG